MELITDLLKNKQYTSISEMRNESSWLKADPEVILWLCQEPSSATAAAYHTHFPVTSHPDDCSNFLSGFQLLVQTPAHHSHSDGISCQQSQLFSYLGPALRTLRGSLLPTWRTRWSMWGSGSDLSSYSLLPITSRVIIQFLLVTCWMRFQSQKILTEEILTHWPMHKLL